MTTPHQATPYDWEAVQLHADPDAYCHRDSCILELRYRVEALEEAQQQAVTEESSAAQDDAPQTLHTIALAMVDTLERLQVLPEILDTLRRAIREPMEQPTPEAAPVATDRQLHLAYHSAPEHGYGPALRTIYDLGRKHGAQSTQPPAPAEPAPAEGLVDALITAECALSDIAEGEPNSGDGDLLKWAERRCAETLAIVRPVMWQHKVKTSEYPPAAQPTLPTTPTPSTQRAQRLLDELEEGGLPAVLRRLATVWDVDRSPLLEDIAAELEGQEVQR